MDPAALDMQNIQYLVCTNEGAAERSVLSLNVYFLLSVGMSSRCTSVLLYCNRTLVSQGACMLATLSARVNSLTLLETTWDMYLIPLIIPLRWSLFPYRSLHDIGTSH